MSFDALDPLLLAEVIIVGLIIVGQVAIFVRNSQAIRRLGKLFPPARLLDVDEEAQVDLQAVDTISVPQLKEQPRFSQGFREIVQMTNDYLRRNKGASQAERLQEIAQRKTDSMEEAIETNLPLPLYIGLLATFTGVIMGLVKIAIVGVTDAAIQGFIGGVVVGMVGSAFGLLLTVRSNQTFRVRKEACDGGLEAYFQFLRTRVVHPEAAPVAGSVRGLRDALTAFQDGFAQYQGQMNESLADTLRLFRELKDVFKQIRSLEQEIRGIGQTVIANDELIDRQVAYLNSYHEKAEAFTRKLGENFQRVDQQVNTLVDQNIKALDDSTKTAYLKMDQYLASLDGGDRQALARSLSEDLSKIKDNVKTLQEKSVHINAQLLQRVNDDTQSRQVLATAVQQMNDRLAQMDKEQRGFLGSAAGQAFVYTGIVAFALGIVSAGIFLVQTLVF